MVRRRNRHTASPPPTQRVFVDDGAGALALLELRAALGEARRVLRARGLAPRDAFAAFDSDGDGARAREAAALVSFASAPARGYDEVPAVRVSPTATTTTPAGRLRRSRLALPLDDNR